ncbi:MAG: hypothetical protein ACHQTF_10795 [Gemmatimonadales bacterium]
MVIAPAHAPATNPESLGASLASAGRSAPIWLLATLWFTGTVVTAALLIGARHHWVLSLPFFLVAAFGAWGLTEQGRDAVNRMQSLNAMDRYFLNGILQVTGVLIVTAGAIVSTIFVFAVTFYLAGAAPVL